MVDKPKTGAANLNEDDEDDVAGKTNAAAAANAPKGQAAGGEYVELEPEDSADVEDSDKRAGRQDAAGDDRIDVESRVGATDETPDQRRDRRRQERKDRKERQRAARYASDRELAELRGTVQHLAAQIGGVGTRLTQQDRQSLINKATQLRTDAAEATRIMAQAIKAGDADAATQAMEIRDKSNFELFALDNALRSMGQPRGAPASGTQPPARDPRVAQYVSEFERRHPWYHRDGADDDSRMVIELDNAVAAAGYHPGTQAYWSELERRIKLNMPDRGTDSDDDQDEGEDGDSRSVDGRAARPPAGARGPKLGTGRSNGGRVQFYVTPERKQAMIDAGIWEDPKRRSAMIRKYAQYDQENAPAAAR